MGVLDAKVAIVTGTSRGVGAGIANELLRAGATVVGCSRSPLNAVPGVDAEPGWAERSHQMVCDQGDYRAIDAMVNAVVERHGRVDILVNNAGGTVPAPHAEDIPALVSRIQGAPRSDDDFERTVLFHAFAVQMNLISPLWFAIRVYRQMRDQDCTGCSINVSGGPGQLCGARPDDHRQLPLVRPAQGRPDGLDVLRRTTAQAWWRTRRGRPHVCLPRLRRSRFHQWHDDRNRRRHAAGRALRRRTEDCY
jgi:NAD(P)-dependent dehydrogenase (short-subunit alcohol dehydrogenase family)